MYCRLETQTEWLRRPSSVSNRNCHPQKGRSIRGGLFFAPAPRGLRTKTFSVQPQPSGRFAVKRRTIISRCHSKIVGGKERFFEGSPHGRGLSHCCSSSRRSRREWQRLWRLQGSRRLWRLQGSRRLWRLPFLRRLQGSRRLWRLWHPLSSHRIRSPFAGWRMVLFRCIQAPTWVNGCPWPWWGRMAVQSRCRQMGKGDIQGQYRCRERARRRV